MKRSTSSTVENHIMLYLSIVLFHRVVTVYICGVMVYMFQLAVRAQLLRSF